MKSVALGESQYADPSDDYVVVQAPIQLSFDFKEEFKEEETDDDSYDYCDDVYSMYSTEPTLSACSDTLELQCLKEEVILSVPSVLFKDIDEMHAAAEVEKLSDCEMRSLASTVTANQSAAEQRDDDVSKAEKLEKQYHDDLATMKPTGGISRTSNKKRRKKLKLMKKAVAAANAAQALAERSSRAASRSVNPTPQKSNGGLQKKLKGNRSNKKIANIAVACATETLSAYREELIMAKQQRA